jgi:hypothetical protein
VTITRTDAEVADEQRKFAEACVHSLWEAGGVKLDYSAASISLLDAAVGLFWPEGKPGAEKEIPGAIFAAAGYLGEVVIRTSPAVHWTWATNIDQPMLEFPGGAQGDVRTWVYKRIAEGPKRDLRHYFKVAVDLGNQTKRLDEVGTTWPWWRDLPYRLQLWLARRRR